MQIVSAVTSCMDRFPNLLPITIESLARARLDDFLLVSVDGLPLDHHSFATVVTSPSTTDFVARPKPLGLVGNWLMTALELFVRHPLAERYCIFQDDVVVDPDLKAAIAATQLDKKYINLSWASDNEKSAASVPIGNGACGLVFDRAGLLACLGDLNVLAKPCASGKNKSTGLDFSIALAMRNQGYTEQVFPEPMLAHTGEQSTIANKRWQLDHDLIDLFTKEQTPSTSASGNSLAPPDGNVEGVSNPSDANETEEED